MARKGRGARMSAKRGKAQRDPALDYTETAADLGALSGDSEDDFHHDRERIAFDDTVDDVDAASDMQEQEVFGLDGVDESDEEIDESDDDIAEDELLLERMRSQGLHLDDINDIAPAKSRSKITDDETLGGWGKRRDAYYDADEISEEEDAKEEEKEALRLQRKQIGALAADDFLEDSFENLLRKKQAQRSSAETPADESAAAESESADAERIRLDLANMTDAEKSRAARRTIPEVVALMDEFKSVLDDMQAATTGKAARLNVKTPAALARSIYLTNMAFFFALAADSDAATRRSHPVVEQLAKLHDLVESLPLNQPNNDSDKDSNQAADEHVPDASNNLSAENDAAVETSDVTSKPAKKKNKRKKKKSKSEAPTSASEIEIPIENYDDMTIDVSPSDDEDDDKPDRTKSLKFHANRIEATAANSRSLKRKYNVGGDDDVPYRDRKASEQVARDRALQQSLESGEYDDDDAQNSDSVDEEGLAIYLQHAAKRAKSISDKEARAAQARAEADAAMTLDDQDESALDESGKRKATWKILANKGLTPHRKKEDRNPRVKKRLRYEKAKKKLSSFRRVAVDRSTLGQYSGEATGIKSNLSRSVKF